MSVCSKIDPASHSVGKKWSIGEFLNSLLDPNVLTKT